MKNFVVYGLVLAVIAFSIGVVAFLDGATGGQVSGLISGVLAATNITSTVAVGNAAPTITSVAINNGGPITLNTNMTTTIYVNAIVGDNNGCSDVFTGGTTSVVVYRSGITSSTCKGAQDNRNCYKTVITANDCSGQNASANTTASVDVWYFADATDASSSYNGQKWIATINATDTSSGSSTADATGQTLNSISAINITTSSINFGSLSAGNDTGATNQSTTVQNAGNTTTSLQLYALQTLKSGSNNLTTGSQRYSTSTFTYAGTSTQLTDSAFTVPGFSLALPTTTAGRVQSTLYWGLQIVAGTPTGTYNGINVFSVLY